MSITLFAQTNINPDSNGDPWITGGSKLMSPEQEALIPELIINAASLAALLPSEVYNDELKYFPPVFDQIGASCIHASEIGYTFTYEINRKRDVQAGVWKDSENPNDYKNVYHHLYTYNFHNNGSGGTFTEPGDGFETIKDNGCPMLFHYYDPILDIGGGEKFKYWMNGYENYYEGQKNKISQKSIILFDYDYESLENIKHWLADHGNNSETGGLAVFSIYTNGWDVSGVLPEGSPHATEKYIKQLGSYSLNSGHALTVVGYDDNIKHKINEGEEYTTTVDVNGDGIVDLRDREFGAFKIVNSWDEDYGNQGFIWLPYSAMPGNFQGPNKFLVCKVNDADYEPELCIKAEIDYPQRNKLILKSAYSQKASANQPDEVNTENYNSFNAQGGENPMRGCYSGSIEIGLDFGYHFIDEDFGKIYLIIEEDDTDGLIDGIIENFSIIDYRWNEEFELPCLLSNVSVENNSETILYVNYDLIPHEDDITQDLVLDSDMVSRFQPTVANNATLSIENGVNIDMYNSSEMHIELGSTLDIGNNVKFTAKNGTCKIIIDGDINIGTGVHFEAEEGAELEIELNNSSENVVFNDCKFKRVRFTNKTSALSIINSEISQFYRFMSLKGDVYLNNNTFNSTVEESWLILQNTDENSKSAEVNLCTFNSDSPHSGIDIYNYENFKIENCNIDGYGRGVQIWGSGDGFSDNLIFNNEINNCLGEGIMIYKSSAQLIKNQVHDNAYGLRLMNNSNVAISGNAAASSYNDINYITNNSSYELYISKYSFPWDLKYNAIIDDDNLGGQSDALLYYSLPGGTTPPRDVRYNCWTLNNNYNVYDDLYPSGYFVSSPTWCPGGAGIPIGIAAQLYSDAQNQINAQDYLGAKETLKLIINLYPSSVYAESAMKELVNLEKLCGNNFVDLKNYYNTNDSITNDSGLSKLAIKLSNDCDVKLGNFQNAIDYYEYEIRNPHSYEDSLFAIIDLGYLYFLMENTANKSSVSASLPEYKPVSQKKFFKHRDYLLSLLPKNKLQNENETENQGLNGGKIINNSPNPFSNSTSIFIALEKAGKVNLRICNINGKEVKNLRFKFEEGKNQIPVDMTNEPAGIYYYSIFVDGVYVESNKMLLIR